MSVSVMGGFLNRVRATVGPADDPRTDAQLLAAFADRRDAAAFALLVRRYGPLVWGVCRRGAGDAHAAEDAFQATFLVLARKAGSVRPRGSAGGWLHRTATNVARKARAMTARRARYEFPTAAANEPPAPPPAEPTDPAALAALDEELARLPDALRAAVVLCELQGASRREAADRLGVPEGTLSSRLAAARKRLAARLRQRGVVPAVGLAALAGADAPARLLAAASALADNTPLAPVAALADGEVRTMLLTKLTALAVGTLAVFAAAFGLWPGNSPAAAPVVTLRVAPVPPPAPREGVIVLTSFRTGTLDVIKPDGTLVCTPPVGRAAAPVNPGEEARCPLWLPRLSPDGKRAVAVRLGPIPQDTGPWTPNHVWVFDLEAKEGPTEPILANARCPVAVWSADGTKLYGSQVDPKKEMAPRENDKPVPLVSWVYDVATKKMSPLGLPPAHEIIDVSRDGKALLTAVEHPGGSIPAQSYFVPLDTLKLRLLTQNNFQGMRFSPDGKVVLGNWSEKKGDKWKLAFLTVADGSVRRVKLPESVSWVRDACWSPDGKRIAYHWYEELPPPPGAPAPGQAPQKEHASRLTVADADGSNAKTIVKRTADDLIRGIDWR